MRSPNYDHAVELINDHEYGNGTAIFTRDGDAARDFADKIEVGMVGINVPIPVPVAYHSFGGWKRSLFGDHAIYGPEGVRFYTRLKTVTTRWPDGHRARRRVHLPEHALRRAAGVDAAERDILPLPTLGPLRPRLADVSGRGPLHRSFPRKRESSFFSTTVGQVKSWVPACAGTSGCGPLRLDLHSVRSRMRRPPPRTGGRWRRRASASRSRCPATRSTRKTTPIPTRSPRGMTTMVVTDFDAPLYIVSVLDFRPEVRAAMSVDAIFAFAMGLIENCEDRTVDGGAEWGTLTPA